MAWVYLIEKPPYTKVGITVDLSNRLRGYQTAAPQRDFEYHTTWLVESIERAREIEKIALRAIDEAWWPRKNEWTKMPAHIVAGIIEEELNHATD